MAIGSERDKKVGNFKKYSLLGVQSVDKLEIS